MTVYSRVSQFLYLAKQNVTLASDRYTADFFYIYKAWILDHLKRLYSNAKLIAFGRNECILHAICLEFCQATVCSIKHIVHMYMASRFDLNLLNADICILNISLIMNTYICISM